MNLAELFEQLDTRIPVEFDPAKYSLMTEHRGREFIKVTTTDQNRQGFTRVYLRKTIVKFTLDENGRVNLLEMPLSYFLAKSMLALMPQTAQDELFGRDGSKDLRHHQQDNAPALGLDPGKLTNDNLAAALAGDFLPDDDDDDPFDDDGGYNTPDDNDDLLAKVGSVFAPLPTSDPNDDLVGSIGN